MVFKVSDSATEDEIKRLAHYNYPTMVKELGRWRQPRERRERVVGCTVFVELGLTVTSTDCN